MEQKTKMERKRKLEQENRAEKKKKMDDFSKRLTAAVEDKDIQSVNGLLKQLELKTPEEKQKLSILRRYQCLRAIQLCSLPLLKLLFSDDIFAELEEVKARVNIEFMEQAIISEFISAIDFMYEIGFRFKIEITDSLKWDAISFSIQQKKTEMLKYILCKPFGKMYHGLNLMTPLAIAALTCNASNLEIILNSTEKQNINEFSGTEYEKWTPLLWCLQGDSPSNMVECVKLLVKAGANVNSRTDSVGIFGGRHLANGISASAVHMAAKQNLLEVLMLLMDNKADVNTPDISGNLPLHYICQFPETTESLKCFRRLIKDTSNINTRNNDFPNKETAFSLAVKTGNCQMVQELAGSGCNIEDCAGQSPLYTALRRINKHQHPKSQMVEQLIHLGFNVNVNYSFEMTPLMLAAESRDTETFKMLLKHGANVNARDKSGNYVIDYCFKCREENPKSAIDILEIILQSNSQINIVQLAKKHSEKVIKNGDVETLELLVAGGFDICHIGEKDENIFHVLARECGHCKELYRFDDLFVHVKVNQKNTNGITPLMVACAVNTGLIEYFINKGADVDVINKVGQTALMMICANYDPKDGITHIKSLLDAGSNPNIQDKNGRTVLQYLYTYTQDNYLDSLKLFLQYGGAASLDFKTEAGFTPLQYVLNTARYSMFWHLLAENCSLVSLKAPESKPPNPSQMVLNMWNKIVKLGKILYLCGASKQAIQEELRFKSNDETRFHGYCNKLSLKELCRRRLRRSIGAGIQQKLSEDSQIPRLLNDFIMLKDVFPAKVFDPNKIPERDSQDNNLVFEVISVNDDNDGDNDVMTIDDGDE